MTKDMRVGKAVLMPVHQAGWNSVYPRVERELRSLGTSGLGCSFGGFANSVEGHGLW